MLEHPHHTLPIIMAVAESFKDREYDNKLDANTSETRVIGAKALIAKYKRNKNIGPIIKNMEHLSNALISLAYLSPENCKGNRKKQHIIPDREKIKSIKNIQNVLLPSLNLGVKKNRDYSNIIGKID